MARELFLLALLILLVIYFAFRSSHFLDLDNLREMASQFSEIGLVALPQTMVILAGGIDLSVVSLL